MKYDKILVVTDNHYLFRKFKQIITELNIQSIINFCCTSSKVELKDEGLFRVNVKNTYKQIINDYNLVISLHCKQIFPSTLVNSIKCINIHPGFNPYNRGWYPQVFSIINKLPVGATIHEMDEHIDHGKIIDQKQVNINIWDTSLDVYNKVLQVELDLIRANLLAIINNEYNTVFPVNEGNYNGIKDFEQLLEISLTEKVTVVDFIDRLRALSHGNFRNAYFYDPLTGKKIFVNIHLQEDE